MEKWEFAIKNKELPRSGLTTDTVKALRRMNNGGPALIKYLLTKGAQTTYRRGKFLMMLQRAGLAGIDNLVEQVIWSLAEVMQSKKYYK